MMCQTASLCGTRLIKMRRKYINMIAIKHSDETGENIKAIQTHISIITKSVPLRFLKLTLGAICVSPTVNYLQYLATGSTLTAARPFQLPVPQSGTLSWISSGTRPSVQTFSHVCLKRTCSFDTSAFRALEVLDHNRAI